MRDALRHRQDHRCTIATPEGVGGGNSRAVGVEKVRTRFRAPDSLRIATRVRLELTIPARRIVENETFTMNPYGDIVVVADLLLDFLKRVHSVMACHRGDHDERKLIVVECIGVQDSNATLMNSRAVAFIDRAIRSEERRVGKE